jgi:uncharacterized protein (TIGR02284 family)
MPPMNTNTTVLETLIDTMHDSVEGYRKAAAAAQTPGVRRVLENQGAKRRRSLDRLNSELVRQGGGLMTKGTTAGALHHVWLEITTLFENGDEAALGRVQEGEDYLAGKIDEALDDTRLDPSTRALLQEVRAEVREGERLAEQIEQQIG